MAHHNRTGHAGEDLAAKYLSENGYSILHRNWRHARREVDIIADKNGILHFVEVKTRRSLKFGHPEEQVDAKKIQNLLHASEEYLYQNPQWQRIQFDILSITMLPGEEVDFFLIEDIYL